MVESSQGLERRELIKRTAVAGAVAWTAPVIIDSMTSPAGAVTAPEPCGCYKLHVDPGPSGPCLKNWDASCVDVGARDVCDGCWDPYNDSTTDASYPLGAVNTDKLSYFCITTYYDVGAGWVAAGECTTGSDISVCTSVQFRIDPGCGFIFDSATSHVPSEGCSSGVITDGCKTATFTLAEPGHEFHLCVSCGTCSIG